MNKKLGVVSLLGLSLVLGACGQTVVEKTVNVPVESDLPLVPVAQRPATPNCGAGAQTSAFRLVGPEKLSGENYISPDKLKAQTNLPGTLQDMLYSTRSNINNFYYGFSTVDVQKVHAQYLAEFKKTRPQNLASYGIDDAVDTLMDEYINAFKDDHTYYLNEDQAQSFLGQTTGTPTPTPAFGWSLDLLPNADGVIVLRVRGDGPSYAAGLRRGDVIVEVDGHALTRVDTSGTDVGDAKNAQAYATILSAAASKGSAVTIKYLRAGKPGSVSEQAQVLSSTRLPYGELIAGTTHYYLSFPSFVGSGIADKVHALVTDAKAKGATDIIIDLRDNGGGSVVQLMGAAGAFSPTTAGEVLEDITANDTTYRYDAANGQVKVTNVCGDTPYILPIAKPDTWTGKTVILTTQYSASASEGFAQILKLGGKTSVIGEQTYGVGNTFTYVFAMPADRALSVTSGRDRLLNGQYATERVTPDLAAKDDLSALAAGNDLALNAALAYLNK